MKSSWRKMLIALGALAAPLAFGAGDYPATPVRLVVAFAPGGGTDGAARIVAERLGPELGQTVVVENRAGAGGAIGAQSVARAAPDGYTLFFGTGAELVIGPLTRRTVPYDVVKDFAPVSEVGGVTFVLVAPTTAPADSVPRLLAQAAARPGELRYSSFGVGSTNHLLAELFLSSTGVKATHIPYKGSQPAMMALLGGEVDFSFETVAVALPQIRAGKLRALATPSPQRLRELPNVPTLQELGYRELVAEGWMGLFAPAGTPVDVVQRLNRAMTQVLQMPEVLERLGERGVKVNTGTPQAYQRKLMAEKDKWQRVVREANVTLTD